MANEPSNAVITIEAREKQIIEQMGALQNELDELKTAKRVWLRLNGQTTIAHAPADKKGRPRPSGTPTNFEMVDMVLASAEKEGKDGLTANEILQEIEKRYWPGVIGEQILPSIYQFRKDGRFRTGANGKFRRAK